MLSDHPSRRLILLGLPALAGCGFVPVYGGGGGVLRGQFQFDTEATIIGFHLRRQLGQRLGEPAAARYVIKAVVTTHERAAAINAAGDTVRLNVVGKAEYSIVAFGSDQQIETGVADAFTSYAATGSTVATQTTRDDAHERLAAILADIIVTRVFAIADRLTQ